MIPENHGNIRSNYTIQIAKLESEIDRMRERVADVPAIHRWRVEAAIASGAKLIADADKAIKKFDKGQRSTEQAAHAAHRAATLQLEAARRALAGAVESGALDLTDDELEALTRAERVAVIRLNAAIRGVTIAADARTATLDVNRLRRVAAELERGRAMAVTVAGFYAHGMGAPPTIQLGESKLAAFHCAHGEALAALVDRLVENLRFTVKGANIAEQIASASKPDDARLHAAWKAYRDAADRLRFVGATAEAQDASRRGSEAMAQLVSRVDAAAGAVLS